MVEDFFFDAKNLCTYVAVESTHASNLPRILVARRQKPFASVGSSFANHGKTGRQPIMRWNEIKVTLTSSCLLQATTRKRNDMLGHVKKERDD